MKTIQVKKTFLELLQEENNRKYIQLFKFWYNNEALHDNHQELWNKFIIKNNIIESILISTHNPIDFLQKTMRKFKYYLKTHYHILLEEEEMRNFLSFVFSQGMLVKKQISEKELDKFFKTPGNPHDKKQKKVSKKELVLLGSAWNTKQTLKFLLAKKNNYRFVIFSYWNKLYNSTEEDFKLLKDFYCDMLKDEFHEINAFIPIEILNKINKT